MAHTFSHEVGGVGAKVLSIEWGYDGWRSLEICSLSKAPNSCHVFYQQRQVAT